MTQPGTPTAETWNKREISAADWGALPQPLQQPTNQQKLLQQNLTSRRQRGYLVAEASFESGPIPAIQSHCKF